MRDTPIRLTHRERAHIKWLTEEIWRLFRRRDHNPESIILIVDTLTYSDRGMWQGWEEPE